MHMDTDTQTLRGAARRCLNYAELFGLSVRYLELSAALSSFALQHSHYIPKPHCDTLWLLFTTPQTPTPYISCHKTHQTAGSKMVHSGRRRSLAKLCDTLLWLMRVKMW